MEGFEIKVGMILKNNTDGTEWRVIHCNDSGVRAIRMNTTRMEIRVFEIQALLSEVFSKTYSLLKDDGSMVFDKNGLSETGRARYENKKALVGRIEKLFSPSYVEVGRHLIGKSMDDLCNEFSLEKSTVYNTIREWLQSGMQDYSLVDKRVVRRTGSKKTYHYKVKTGKPSRNRQGVPLSKEVLQHFEEALQLMKRNRNMTKTEAYRQMLGKHYMVNGENGWSLLPDDKIPTFMQFRHYLDTSLSIMDQMIIKTSEQEYNNDNREQRGTTYDMELRPGSLVEVDALESDFMILSSLVDDQIVGRPIIYFMVDAFSHAIVAFSIGYDNNSNIGLSNLMLNLVDDNDRYFRRHGLDSMVGRMPFRFIPLEIRTDGGVDFTSDYFKDVCNELNITLSKVRKGSGSLKGSVEQSFRQFHLNWAAEMTNKGYIEKRYDSNHKSHTCLKMEHIILMVTSFIIKYNNRSMNDLKVDADLLDSIDIKSPMAVWQAGVKKLGNPKPISTANFAQVLHTLKFSDTATISKAGFSYRGLEYIPRQDDFQLREIIRRSRQNAGKRKKDGSPKNSIPIRFDPRCIDTISVDLDGNPHVCDLKPSTSGGLSGISFMEYEDYLKCDGELNAKGGRHNLEQGVSMSKFTREVGREIESSKSRNKPVQTGIREARRKEQFKSYEETAIDKRQDVADQPSLPPTRIAEVPEEPKLPVMNAATVKDNEEVSEHTKHKTPEELKDNLLKQFYKGIWSD